MILLLMFLILRDKVLKIQERLFVWIFLKIINEPSVTYGLQNKGQNNDKNILIFDLGGRTFDISILNLNDIIFEDLR